MQKIILSLIIAICLLSCGDSNPKTSGAEPPKKLIIEIKSIVGKSEAEVEKILGKAEKTEKVNPGKTPCPCDKLYYKSGKYEIVFINGKADWITIYDVSDLDTDENVIELLGLPKTEPDFNSPHNVMRWNNVANIKEVTFFDNGSGKIDYIYIKFETE